MLLGAIGIYKPLVEWAGAGASVPLTGFGYLLSDGIRTAIKKMDFLVCSRHLTASAGGITRIIIRIYNGNDFKPR